MLGRDHFNVSTVIRQSGKMVAVGDKFPDANLHDQFPPDFKVRRRPLNPPVNTRDPGGPKKEQSRIASPSPLAPLDRPRLAPFAATPT